MTVASDCTANPTGSWHEWVAGAMRPTIELTESNLSCRWCSRGAFVKGETFIQWKTLAPFQFHQYLQKLG